MNRFWQDKRGSVAIIAAVSAMLLVVIAGAAVDFATAYYVRGSLQSAVDSASLAAGRLNIDPKDSIPVKEQQLTAEARNVFRANLDLSPGLVTVEPLEVSYTPPVGTTPDTVTASVAASISTNFLHIVGIPQLSLTVNSETQRPQPGPIDLALVLDTTASMDQTPTAGGSEKKITTLKTAALELVGDLMKVPSVQIGVVPYNTYVTTGVINPTPSWILPVPRFFGSRCTVFSTTGCTPRVYYDCLVDGVMTKNGCYNQTCPCLKTEDVNAVWDGLVSIRSVLPPNNLTNPVANKYTEQYLNTIKNLPQSPSTTIPVYPGLNSMIAPASIGPTKIRPLTSNEADVRSTINTLKTVGETFIPGGLIWGWNILDPNEPYVARTQNQLKAIGGRKVMVLMTDGINSSSPRLYDGGVVPNGNGTILALPWRDGSKSNELITQICNNIKADGIYIFTVLFDVNDPGIRNRLKNCATSESMSFTADKKDDLIAAFRDIGNQLTYLKILK